MSAPLTLTADDLRSLATFLDIVTDATRQTGVRIANYNVVGVAVAGTNIEVAWDSEAERYEIYDRVGS